MWSSGICIYYMAISVDDSLISLAGCIPRGSRTRVQHMYLILEERLKQTHGRYGVGLRSRTGRDDEPRYQYTKRLFKNASFKGNPSLQPPFLQTQSLSVEEIISKIFPSVTFSHATLSGLFYMCYWIDEGRGSLRSLGALSPVR